jgi:ATP-binding cassette subfamily B protein/subfamily B ATP-binding cassette protein MsbA
LKRQIQEQASRDLQLSIFTHLRKLGFAYYERHPVGETLSLLNTEVGAVQQLYRELFPTLLSSLAFSGVSVFLMLSTNVTLTLIAISSFFFYYIFGPYLERKAAIYGRQLADERVETNRMVYESVSALTELRAYGSEKWDFRRYLQKLDQELRSSVLDKMFAYMRGSNRRLSYNLGGIFIFIYGYHLVLHNSMSVGEFVSFLLYYFISIHRMTFIVQTITEQYVLMYQAQKLYDFMNLKIDVEEPEHPQELAQVRGDLEFRNVQFSYFPDQPVLQKFHLQIPEGHKVALVGASGSGKSTVLKLAGRFYEPQGGDILLDGTPISRLSFDTLRKDFGYVFQETYLFGTSVMENIRFGHPEATDEEVKAAARAANAHNFITKLPDGYNTLVGERGVRLSGGQKQRIAIARMFVKQPRVILLDEATSALDNTSEAEVQQAFERMLQGRTILAVAHRISTIQNFDQIVVMDQGKVAEIGTYNELMSSKGLFYQLVEGKISEAV